MAKKQQQEPPTKSAQDYEEEIKQMIIECKGECKLWYMLQIRSTAMNLAILDRVQKEILSAKDLIKTKSGSTGQIKSEVNPLLPSYDRLQNTLLKQFKALGLQMDAPDSSDDDKEQDTAPDPMLQFYEESRNQLRNPKKK